MCAWVGGAQKFTVLFSDLSLQYPLLHSSQGLTQLLGLSLLYPILHSSQGLTQLLGLSLQYPILHSSQGLTHLLGLSLLYPILHSSQGLTQLLAQYLQRYLDTPLKKQFYEMIMMWRPSIVTSICV